MTNIPLPNVNLQLKSYDDSLLVAFQQHRLLSGLSVDVAEVNITGDLDALRTLSIAWGCVWTASSGSGGTFSLGSALHGTYDKRNWGTTINLYGDKQVVDEFAAAISTNIQNNPCFVKYVYDPEYLNSMMVPVDHSKLPIQEMYPFLGTEKLEHYYERFLASTSNILVLIGPPGTGKTSFIRGLMSHTKRSATLAYNHKILAQDAFFVDWLESDNTFIIMEDSDDLIRPRADGNDMMSRFLNLGDGLMTFVNKKMVFSTNLPSRADIDPALLRPGRCFDVLEFDYLTRDQALSVAEKTGITIPDGSKISVADIFADRNPTRSPATSFGFI